jgi:hypothetical protein
VVPEEFDYVVHGPVPDAGQTARSVMSPVTAPPDRRSTEAGRDGPP